MHRGTVPEDWRNADICFGSLTTNETNSNPNPVHSRGTLYNSRFYLLVSGSIANIGGYESKCTSQSELDLHLKVIPGVLGAPSSVTSIQVATLLKLFKIPQVRKAK